MFCSVFFQILSLLRFCTYEGSLVGHRRQDFIQDEEKNRYGQKHGHFEAQLLPSIVGNKKGGQIESQEEQDGQQEVDDVQQRPPLNGEL